MCHREQLRCLTGIRGAVLNELAKPKLTRKGARQLREIVTVLDQRIQSILEMLNSDDPNFKENRAKNLEETKSEWFNAICSSILKATVAHEFADQFDLTLIFQKFFDLI